MKRTPINRKGGLKPRIALKPRKIAYKRRRRKKGEIPKLKEQLWGLCRNILIRRYGYKCYTCGKVKRRKGALHTGHYIASSLCSIELRYDLKNLRRQCYACNINRSGNTLRFQKYLTRDHGPEYVEELWDRNEATKGKIYPKEWFIHQISTYSQLLKDTESA